MGLDRASVVGKPFSLFIHRDDQDTYYHQRKRLEGNGQTLGWDSRLAQRDGAPFWAHLEAAAEQTAEGVRKLRVVFSDITAKKQAEARQALLEAELEQSHKMESLGLLAGGVAHDMNNVLAAILALASTRQALEPLESPTHLAFKTISEAAARGGEAVKRLLRFARKTPMVDELVDLNEVITDELRLLANTTLSRIHLEQDLQLGLRPIHGDPGALTHAFLNLCVNALEAIPDQGTISFHTRNVDRDWVEVRVEDSGCGMSKEVLAKAMDPFFTTKELGKGTGLGLAMVYGTVKAHQGQVELHSEPGKGTQVILRFPACDGLAHPPAVLPEAHKKAPQGALRLMVVDDEPMIRSAVRELLEALGHQVTTAGSCAEAMAKVEAELPLDGVILDMNMPVMGGAATLPRLRALLPALPIILSTGNTDQTALDLVANHAHVTLLPKPFSVADMKRVLDLLPRG